MLSVMLFATSLSVEYELSLRPLTGFQILCIDLDAQLLKFYRGTTPVDAIVPAIAAKDIPPVNDLQPRHG
jgi:hypothetical protein